MTTTQIKFRLLKQIEQLSSSSLKELYGIFLNYFNSRQHVDEWALLGEKEKTAIEAGLEQLNKGQKISRKDAINKLRKRYHA